MFRHDRWLSWLAALAVLAICSVLLARETHPGYRSYQQGFRRLVEERFGPERAAQTPEGVQQIWLPSADRVDRCVSCHLGVTWTGLENADPPFTTHPKAPLEHHPVETFGCTLCHGGQGAATRLPDAHGWVAHWEDPLLDRRLAKDYDLDPWSFLEIKCNQCHRFDDATEGAPHINRGKELIQKKGCRACHLINGRGGHLGPDLSREGERNPDFYDYSRLTTFASLLNWQMGHLQNPKSFSAETIMPDFGFNRSDTASISLVILSWRDVDLPAHLLPGAILRDEPTPQELERERIMREGEGRFFVEKTCFICHDVSSLGIESATKIGPDLAIAFEDAPRRFGRTLDDFLMNPSGTMQVVLSKQIELSVEERREAIRLLKIAYERHQKQRAETEGAGGEP